MAKVRKGSVLMLVLVVLGVGAFGNPSLAEQDKSEWKTYSAIFNVKKIFVHSPNSSYSFLVELPDKPNVLVTKTFVCWTRYLPGIGYTEKKIGIFLDVPRSDKMWVKYTKRYRNNDPNGGNSFCELEMHVRSEDDLSAAGSITKGNRS